MFLRCKKRRKDGKVHQYWSIVENRRVTDGRILQRHVLYLGELNGVQEASWRRTVELFSGDGKTPQQVSLFPEEHLPGDKAGQVPSIGIPPFRFGYSRDKRGDCVQVVIALIVTPEGFPIAYEVLAGNTADKTTLADFLSVDGRIVMVALYQIHIVGVRAKFPHFHRNLVPLWSQYPPDCSTGYVLMAELTSWRFTKFVS